MWYLIEDFFEQNLLMKAFIGFGWLCVWVMIFSMWDTGKTLFPEAPTPTETVVEQSAE